MCIRDRPRSGRKRDRLGRRICAIGQIPARRGNQSAPERPHMSLSIGVDIGGTKIAAGVVSERGEIVAESSRETPATDPDLIVEAVVALVRELRTTHDIQAVGIGAAGFIDANRSTVLFAPNINWIDEPLAKLVGDQMDARVIVENDANAAAWGEFQFGAGEDVDDLLLVTVGTGIGGGLVHDGALYRGGFGIAAEIGHMRVVPGGIQCGCGQQGCWEKYGSGSALVSDAMKRIHAGDRAAHALRDRMGTDTSDVHGSVITELAQGGDALCVELVAGVGTWLGEGIASLAAVLDPTVVVIGGGVAAAGPLILEPARDAFERTLSAPEHRPHAELRLATLGNRAGLIGAADLARRV